MCSHDAYEVPSLWPAADGAPACLYLPPVRASVPLAGVQEQMVCMAVTSDLGKRLLREYCLPEAFCLLQSLRNVRAACRRQVKACRLRVPPPRGEPPPAERALRSRRYARACSLRIVTRRSP